MNLKFERKFLRKFPHHAIIGLDEVGRGALAGPVAAAAFCFNLNKRLPKVFRDLKDSKGLSFKKRGEFFNLFKKYRLNFFISYSKVKTIDKKGINQAIFLAMARAAKKLIKAKKAVLLIDGRDLLLPKLREVDQFAIIKGDKKIVSIAAASVVAKVFRDRLMIRQHKFFKKYNFPEHKGYGTRAHLRAIKKYGLSLIHRKNFCRGF